MYVIVQTTFGSLVALFGASCLACLSSSEGYVASISHHFTDRPTRLVVPLAQTMLILIVEDDLIVAWSLADALRESGHTILGPTASSREAIELSARYAPRLALVDITLDGQVEGITLARRLKNEMNIASVFMTAQPTLARENADAALGLIEKPYVPQRVSSAIAALAEVLEGRAAHCRASVLEWFGKSSPSPPTAA